jgi:hypothetical protein
MVIMSIMKNQKFYLQIYLFYDLIDYEIFSFNLLTDFNFE